MTAPGVSVSSGTWACCPRVRFSGRDRLCTVAASCSRPRTVSGYLGGARCDRPPSLQRTVHFAGTRRTTDAGVEKPLTPFAICGHTLGTLLIWFLPDALACVRHSTSCPSVSAVGSRGGRRGDQGISALAAPPSVCIGSCTSRPPARRPFCRASPSPPLLYIRRKRRPRGRSSREAHDLFR